MRIARIAAICTAACCVVHALLPEDAGGLVGLEGAGDGVGAGAGAALEEDGLLPSPPPPPPQPARGRRAAADSMPASMRACAERASAKLKRLVLMLKLDPRR